MNGIKSCCLHEKLNKTRHLEVHHIAYLSLQTRLTQWQDVLFLRERDLLSQSCTLSQFVWVRKEVSSLTLVTIASF